MMDEKRYYDEKPETKQMTLVCPHCREEGTFPVRWMMRSKKSAMPPGGDADDRAKFAKARSYMVRMDDLVACRNMRQPLARCSMTSWRSTGQRHDGRLRAGEYGGSALRDQVTRLRRPQLQAGEFVRWPRETPLLPC